MSQLHINCNLLDSGDKQHPLLDESIFWNVEKDEFQIKFYD